jgi:holin-like protein
MKILRQLGLVLVLWLVGEFCSKVLMVPIPGSVIGMILLFALLSTGLIKLDMLKELSSFLLDNMAFFFVPLGVGLLQSMELIKGNLLQIVLIVVVTTILVTTVTGITVQTLAKERDR